MTRRILVVEDSPDMAALLSLHIETLGFRVDVADNGNAGLELAQDGDFDLIVLDLVLPGMDGLELCRRLRRKSVHTPILMLTAKTGEVDRVLGLELGADDYLTKPFSIREFLARVKAIFRRLDEYSRQGESGQERLSLGNLSIHLPKRRVSVDEQSIDLTAKEFDLLVQFAKHPGRVFSRSQLLDLVWGYGHAGYEHTVNSHINRLRSKIEFDRRDPKFILTVWGVGYKFNDRPGP